MMSTPVLEHGHSVYVDKFSHYRRNTAVLQFCRYYGRDLRACCQCWFTWYTWWFGIRGIRAGIHVGIHGIHVGIRDTHPCPHLPLRKQQCFTRGGAPRPRVNIIALRSKYDYLSRK